MSSDYRDRFGLSHHPFDKRFLHRHPFETAATTRLQERFRWLSSERGLGILTGQSGVGKTAALNTIVRKLPSHRYRVVYLEDSGANVSDIFRSLAYALDMEPAFRRAALWRDLKATLLKLDDDNDQQTVLVIDDAHHLPHAFLDSLAAFMNFAFDSREVLTTWLVGDSRLTCLLGLTIHKHLLTRVRMHVHIDPMERTELRAYIQACLAAAGCNRQVVTDPGIDAVFHLSRGVPRTAAKLLGLALRLAHEQDKDIVCDRIIEDASKESLL